ncbi:MAG: hypothetical protein ACJATT_005942, partial [Myxococcota bacterium]
YVAVNGVTVCAVDVGPVYRTAEVPLTLPTIPGGIG